MSQIAFFLLLYAIKYLLDNRILEILLLVFVIIIQRHVEIIKIADKITTYTEYINKESL